MGYKLAHHHTQIHNERNEWSVEERNKSDWKKTAHTSIWSPKNHKKIIRTKEWNEERANERREKNEIVQRDNIDAKPPIN